MLRIIVTYHPHRRKQFVVMENLTVARLCEAIHSKGKPLQIWFSNQPPTLREVEEAKSKGLLIQ